MTHREKMVRGLWYDANGDAELLELRAAAEELCFRLNQTAPSMAEEREEIFRLLLPNRGESATILYPFYTDYGFHCTIGAHTYINRNAYLMDCAPIRIGVHCFIGPNCGMYTAIHPLLPRERDLGLERALPIVIGDHVWIGGDVTILPGVTIGEGAVIGAKSVVTKDIPDHVLAMGNPCRVLREITQEDGIQEESSSILPHPFPGGQFI